MKVYYDSDLVFDLPTTYGLEERLDLINEILDTYNDKFQLAYDDGNIHDQKIYRVLDKFAYYLCTYQTKQENGKALYKDRQKEMPLFSFYE